MYTEEQLAYIRSRIAYILDSRDNEAMNYIMTVYVADIAKYENFLQNDAEKYVRRNLIVRILMAIPMAVVNPAKHFFCCISGESVA